MIQTGKELAAACEQVAKNNKTLYVLGAFGWPMNATNIRRALNGYGFNRNSDRAEKINAADENTFGFDCVCFIKALLWGWTGDNSKNYGGATYASNGVPDIDESTMLECCREISTDFSKISVGEVLWQPGHIGVYIGNGLAVECTYRWKDGVQITAVHNISVKKNYNGRTWEKHGKLPWLHYEEIVPVSNGFTLPFVLVKNGNSGEFVEAIQMLLIGKGYRCGSTGVDGKFGNNTEKAVKAYQEDYGLQVDGIVGKETLESLLGVLNV